MCAAWPASRRRSARAGADGVIGGLCRVPRWRAGGAARFRPPLRGPRPAFLHKVRLSAPLSAACQRGAAGLPRCGGRARRRAAAPPRRGCQALLGILGPRRPQAPAWSLRSRATRKEGRHPRASAAKTRGGFRRLRGAPSWGVPTPAHPAPSPGSPAAAQPTRLPSAARGARAPAAPRGAQEAKPPEPTRSVAPRLASAVKAALADSARRGLDRAHSGAGLGVSAPEACRDTPVSPEACQGSLRAAGPGAPVGRGGAPGRSRIAVHAASSSAVSYMPTR